MKDILSKFTKLKTPKPKNQFGLDIGSYSVKVCVVKTENNTKELLAYACVPIQNSNVKEAIQKALASTKIEAKSVNISTGTQGVVTRQIVFPKMTQVELNEALKFEAEKYIPYKVGDVIMDSQILKQEVEPNKMLLLLAAVKKEIIEKRMGLIKEMGLRINIIDADILSLVNAFNYILGSEETEKKNFALLNIGNTTSSVMIIKDGLPYVARDIVIAGRDLTKRIADNLTIEISEAEALKTNPKDRQKEVFATYELLLSELCAQIRMSFDYFENQSGVTVEHVYLSGGTSKLAGLDKTIESLLGVKVSPWNDFHNLSLNSNLDRQKFLDELPYLNLALGLALR